MYDNAIWAKQVAFAISLDPDGWREALSLTEDCNMIDIFIAAMELTIAYA